MCAHVDDANPEHMGQKVQGGASQPRKSSNPFSISLPTLSPHPIDKVVEAGAVPLLELGFDSLPYLLVSKSVSKYCARALLLC